MAIERLQEMYMSKFLGETLVDVNKTKEEWVMEWIESYRGIDGEHHQNWLTDQIARILKGTPVISKLAKWESGTEEYRYDLDKPSQEYLDWVAEMRSGEDGPYTYGYDVGSPP